MIYRRQDANGDYSFGRNSQDFLSGADAVQQAIKTRLLLLLGEWWEDQEDGLPFFESIAGALGANPQVKRNIDSLIRERILGTKEVQSIDSFESVFDRASRQFSVSAVVNTVYGRVPVEVTF